MMLDDFMAIATFTLASPDRGNSFELSLFLSGRVRLRILGFGRNLLGDWMGNTILEERTYTDWFLFELWEEVENIREDNREAALNEIKVTLPKPNPFLPLWIINQGSGEASRAKPGGMQVVNNLIEETLSYHRRRQSKKIDQVPAPETLTEGGKTDG